MSQLPRYIENIMLACQHSWVVARISRRRRPTTIFICKKKPIPETANTHQGWLLTKETEITVNGC